MLTGEAIKVSPPSAAQVASLPFSNHPASSTRGRELKSQEEGGASQPAEVGDTLEVSELLQNASVDANPSEALNDKRKSEESQKAKEDKKALEEETQKKLEERKQANEENLALRFGTDEETGTDFFQLVDTTSGDVVRQIPSENVLEFMKRFKSVTGLLFSEQA